MRTYRAMVLDNTNCLHSSLPANPDLEIRACNRLGARGVIAARAQTLPDSTQTLPPSRAGSLVLAAERCRAPVHGSAVFVNSANA